MQISVRWLNTRLNPGDAEAGEVESVLTHAGFPVEGREDLPGGDAVLDVEVTSNRGDTLCHAGMAREVAAATGRDLSLPEIPPAVRRPRGSTQASSVTGVDNRVPDDCPRFTARVIRGAKVGPSPEWLRTALEAIGQRSINNVVDASNYVLFDLGQPSHVFDMNTLAEQRLVIRRANKGETLLGLDEITHKLTPDDVVVADAQKPVGLAGVIGGLETALTSKTTDLLVEVATWIPANVRNTSRRLRISTDAAHRYERMVDPGLIDEAGDRLAALLLDLAGGELLPGVIDEGPRRAARAPVSMRASRCRALLGVDIDSTEMARLLTSLDIDTRIDEAGDTLVCDVPAHRPDLTREVDLIEEVARVHGYEKIPVAERLEVQVARPQESERALRELGSMLAGMGFYETVTFSFVTHDDAAAFMPDGLRALAVDEERRKGAPALRPSVIPSLLRCRRANQDGGVELPDGVRLFETASVYAEDGRTSATIENRNLALLADAPDAQAGVRLLRGVIESAAHAMGGPAAAPGFASASPHCESFEKDAFAHVSLGGNPLGYVGLVSSAAQRRFGLDTPVVGAEVNLDALLNMYPPKSTAAPLPAFPSIERDLSVVVDEATPWAAIESAVRSADPALIVGLSFVGVWRGKQIGAGKKSVTFRMRFRDAERTLRHEEVDPQVKSVVKALGSAVGAEIRA